ncbi:MAG TPA: FAD-dependent monooxygenase, partial [Gemmatimonadaceae bacterium]|nr:FAD-dependent monooxygenase [Gemmatimonadaceae bacterium]
MRDEVLIVGAGPTGLVMALWLTKIGIRVRIIDKAPEPGTTSRALAVQARTLELYRQLDLADAVIARGLRAEAMNMWVQGERRARVPFGAIGAGMTPYPYLEIFPQDEHERLLIERLEALGVSVERQSELVAFSDDGERIKARIHTAGGKEEVSESSYVVGCDGARSTVRQQIGVNFPGGTYRQVFYVADVEASGLAVNGELNVALDRADFILVFPMTGKGRVRLVGVVSDQRAEHEETLTFGDVSQTVIDALQIHVDKVNWFSTYRVHHRVADHFRKGRAFLAGDAGHIHSPAGGQGMNTGIGDAINLAWKLAAVVRDQAQDELLDSYEAERIGFARRLVQTTDRIFTFATAEGHVADFVRTRVAPFVLPIATHIGAATEFMFRTVSQTMLNYRNGPLSEGKAGDVQGGDRLPWVAMDGVDNYDSLSAISWQVHVYGTAKDSLVHWCAARGIPLHAFPWAAPHEDAGLARDAAYLLRPDTYVAMAEPF